MTLRTAELEPLVAWLDGLLTGAFVQEVRVPSPRTVVLELRRPGETVRLLLSVERGLARLHTVRRAPPNPPKPYALQGLLRKELRGTVRAIRLLQGDRVVELDLGERALVAVLFEPAELLLLDGERRVLGSSSPSRARASVWNPPPPGGQRGADRFAPAEGAERDAAIAEHYASEALERRRRDLRRRLTARRKSLERKAERQEAEADRGDDAERLQRDGDLLQGAFGRLRRGMESIEVPDFYAAEPGATRRLELLPALDAEENVARLYNRARRARRAEEEAGRRLLETLDELEELERTLLHLDEVTDEDELELLARALPTRRGRRRSRATPRLPYRSYRTPAGVEVRVGRGAKDNDDLTFRHSKGNDVWMHVRGRPGAHVVVREAGASPPLELLLLAAQVALKHSGAKDGAREEVAWTRVKRVRKAPGMAPGKVLVTGEKVLYVELDPAELARLEKIERE